MPRVTVEFYGLARHRAKRAELLVTAATVGEALTAADTVCPELRATSDIGLSREYRVSVGGKHFTEDLNEPLAEGDAVLILGADAGG